MELDVRLVRSFVAVAETRSFTRAAERLRVAQPWLSVQIRKLEEQLGFTLFDRNRNRTVVISAEAEALLPAARDYLLARERMIGSAQRIRDHAGQALRIGAPDFTAEMPMRIAILDAFEASPATGEFEVVNAWTVELLKRLRNGELDAAFTVGPHVETTSEALVVARYDLALLARVEDLAALPDPLPMAALAKREVAIFRRNLNQPFYDAIAPILERADIGVAALLEPAPAATYHNVLRNGGMALVGSYTNFASLPAGLGLRFFVGAPLAFNLNLVRRIGEPSRPVAMLWDITHSLQPH